MNHNKLRIITVRAFTAWILLLSAASYGCDDNKIGNVGFEHQLESIDAEYEQHPLLIPEIKRAFIDSNQTTFSELKNRFENADTVWSLHNGERVNNACGSACLDVLRSETADARVAFETAADQKSKWGAYYTYLYSLCDGDLSNAKKYARLTSTRDYFRNTNSYIPPYRHVMAMIGFPAYEKFNLLSIHDKMLVQSLGKTIGDLAYPLSVCAADNNDIATQTLCLGEAVKHNNIFLRKALADLDDVYNAQVKSEYTSERVVAKNDAAVEPIAVQLTEKVPQAKEEIVHHTAPIDEKKDVPPAPQPQAVMPQQEKSSEIVKASTAVNTQITHERIARKIKNPAPAPVTKGNDNKALTNNTAQAKAPIKAVQVSAPSKAVETKIPVNVVQAKAPIQKQASPVAQPAITIVPQEPESIPARTNVVEVRKKEIISKEAVLQAIETVENNNGRRIAILKELSSKGAAHAQYLLSMYNLNYENPDKKRITEGWQFLEVAAEGDDRDACMAFITRGLKETEKKEAVAHYIQNLLEDEERMARIKLSDDDLGLIYSGYGAYFAQVRNDEKAIEFLQEAADRGEHTHAYTLAKLYENKGFFGKAEEHYELTAGDKKRQAEWNSAVLKYSTTNDDAARKLLLQRFSKQCIGNDDHTLLHDEIAPLLKHERVQDRLIDDAQGGSEEASFVLAFCAHTQLMKQGVECLQATAVKYCIQSIDQAKKNDNAVCGDASLMILRQLRTEGNKQAELYLRKHAPSTEQSRLDLLYRSKSHIDTKLEADEINALKKDAQIDDPVIAFQARALLANDYMRQAQADPAKARELLRKAIEFARGGMTQSTLMQPADAQAKRAEVLKVQSLQPQALTALARITKDSKEQEQYYKEAADDLENPNPQACTWMYRHTNDEKYLRKALRAGEAEARWINAQELLRQNPGLAAAVHEIDSILAHIEQNKDCVSDQIKAQIYNKKAELCVDPMARVPWYCKAVEAGDTKWAFLAAIGFISEDQYDKAMKAIEKVDADSKCIGLVPMVKQYIGYLSSPNDKKREAVLKECICILRGAVNEPLPPSGRSTLDTVLEKMNLSAEGSQDIEKEVLMLYKYLQKEYQAANDIGTGLQGRPSMRSALCIVADMSYQGVGCDEPNLTQAVSTALKCLAEETCFRCRRHSRDQLYMIMKGNNLHVAWSPAVDKEMQAVYKYLQEDKDPSEANKYIESQMAEYFALSAFSRGNIKELLQWYPRVPDSVSTKKRYTAILHENNLLGEKNAAEALKKALALHEEVALAGDPVVQEYLATIYCEGLKFPSGAKLHSNLMKALEWAHILSGNPAIRPKQGAIVCRVIAKNTFAELEQAIDDCKADQAQEQYVILKEYCEKGLWLGDYALTGYYLQACALMKNTAQAEQVYKAYINDAQLWSTTFGALSFARGVMKSVPHYTKDTVQKLIPCLMVIHETEKGSAGIFFDYLAEVMNLLRLHANDYKTYGFGSKTEMVQARAEIEASMQQHAAANMNKRK